MTLLTEVLKARVDIALDQVRDELLAAIERFSPIASAHEGKAVIEEELDELWADIKEGRPAEAWQEAIQVAAMAVRFVVDLYDEQGAPK